MNSLRKSDLHCEPRLATKERARILGTVGLCGLGGRTDFFAVSRRRILQLVWVLIVVVVASCETRLLAQEPAPATVQSTTAKSRLQTRTLHSQALGRALKYRVWLPPGYFNATKRYPVLYLLHGWHGDETNWSTLTKLTKYADNLPVIIVMPDGQDSWYVDSALDEKAKFEAYLMQDLIQAIEQSWRTVQGREGRAIAGLSMGGYGAVKEALKHPEMFRVAASLSGAFNAGSPELEREREDLRPSLTKAFGPERSETRQLNDLYALAQKADAKAMPYLYIDCGNQDESFLEPNRKLAAILSQRKFLYEYHEFPGAHDWQYWDKRLPVVLSLVRELLVKQ
jgi:putative tributyrin esterase